MEQEKKDFKWIPFYMELAKALLSYKDDRKPLVDWIYSDLSQVGTKSMVEYLHMEDKSPISDIDPFSVFAIFNRGLKLENKIAFLEKFKEKFSLENEVPTDFSGIPTLDSRRAFFFGWGDDNAQRILDLWELFEKVVKQEDISEIFDKVIAGGVSRNSLTMILYWISPYKFIGLDEQNRSYLNLEGFPKEFPDLNYANYSDLIEEVKSKMSNHSIPFSSFPELSYYAWSLGQTEAIWMYKRYEDTFAKDFIRMGSNAKGMLTFSAFKTKSELRKAYQNVVGNTDNSIPDMYWKLIKEAKVGDIVVVFDSYGSGKSFYHQLYGWGRITSDVIFDTSDDNPIHRTVEWHTPFPVEPIKESRTTNTYYFHQVKGIDAANIINLLNINDKGKMSMEKSTNNKYVQLLKTNKNLILTGAPGTGKTYLAKEIAKEMLGVESVEALSRDKRFGFVQFHPSYDYTDFVEGLRPTKDINGFERKDGVFKEFCKHAILSKMTDPITFDEINNNPIVWKVSLEGTGDNPTRKDCMENGYIRIGWQEYGDVDDFNEFDGFSEGGKNVLRAFQNGMQIGDIVVSCYSAKEIDAVGVITGNYEYRAEGGHYPRYRTVRWLIKDIRENIIELNNSKPFTLSAIYKARISAEAALEIVQKYTNNNADVARQDTAVFVIDEINRGEISKIFGELFFSIDPGYRGKKGIVKTQYQNMIDEGDAFKDGFYVPENVYIIGTMNDIDRSVESMDFAMRRRFAWEEVTAEESMIMLNGVENEAEIKARMISLNNAIAKMDGLGTQYQIGAAYFKKIADNKENFQELWDYHLKGLLFEYLRGSRDVNSQMDKLEKAYNRVNPDESVD